MSKLGPRMSRWLGRVPIALAIAAAVHPLAKLLARWDWRADLISHFQEPALAFTLATSLALARRHRRFALGFLVLAGFQAFPLLKYWGANPVRPGETHPPVLCILSANVLMDNDHFAEMDARLAREKPDVVGFLEYSDEWAYGMANLAREYKYRYEAPDGPRGLALWFREKPLQVDPPERPTADGFPFLHARFRFAGKDRDLWLVHPSSPFRRLGRHRGFPELDGLAAEVAGTPGSRIVIGDMNTTDGSPHFADFLRTTGLRDSRLGFGRQPSWPSWSIYRIPIDHALVTDDLAVIRRQLLPPNGSDHLALLVELAPAATAASTGSTQSKGSSP